MTDTARADKLRTLIGRLGDVQKERLLDSTGLDVDRWQIDEAKFSDFEKSLIDYRKMLAASAASSVHGTGAEQMPHIECDSCGVSEMESTYYVTIPRCATLCAECTNLLVSRARDAQK